MEDSHAAVLDLRKKNPEDLQDFDETEVSNKPTKNNGLVLEDSTPVADRVSFFAVYDGHGGEFC